MKKFLKWGGITLIVLVVLSSIMSVFEEPAEPIPENRELNIEQSEVYGDNAEVFSVIPGKYTINYNDGKLYLKVRLKLNQTVKKDLKVEGPELCLKNETGISVTGEDYESTLTLGLSERSKMLTFLHSEPGTEQSFIFMNSHPSKVRTIMASSHSFIINDLKLKTAEQVAKEKEASDKAMDRIFGSNDKEEAKSDKKKEKRKRSSDPTLDDMEKLIDLSGDMLQLGKETMELANELEENK